MQILLFIFYVLLGCFFFYFYRFDRDTGLSRSFILFLFIVKVLAGTVNMYIHFYLYVTNDIGFYYWQAINELKGMKTEPLAFFKEWLFNWGNLSKGLDWQSGNASVFWKDLGVLFHTKYMVLANFFSLGQQYVNVIIYNFPFFIGQLYFYKVFYRKQPEKKWLLVMVIFLIPSVLFWCSGIHKDGWILVAIGMMVWSLDKYLESKAIKHLLIFFVFAFFLFVMRYFFLICMIPALLGWIYSHNKTKQLLRFSVIYALSALVFFNAHRILPGVNLMNLVSARQHEFMKQKGYSDMQTPILEDKFQSYITGFPTAANHIFTQPRYTSNAPFKYKFSAIDTFLVLFLIIFLALFIKTKNLNNPVALTLLFYSISVYILIGYTIPNCGALVRYKSEFTVLLLASLVALSELPRINQYLNKKLQFFDSESGS